MDALQDTPLAPFNLSVRHRFASVRSFEDAAQDRSGGFEVNHLLADCRRIESQLLCNARRSGGAENL